jgi:hypothetical protein
MQPNFQFKSKLWLYDGPAAWHFITVPKKLSAQIKTMALTQRGFGSVKVEARIGKSVWSTSIFPDKSKYYLLPIKSEVRKAELLKTGQLVTVELKIM